MARIDGDRGKRFEGRRVEGGIWAGWIIPTFHLHSYLVESHVTK